MTSTHPKFINRLLDPVAAGALTIAGVSLVCMVGAQAWQVFARYVMNDSPGWTEPVALVLMSVSVMFGAAVAVRRESHFAFNGLAHAAPERAQRLLRVISRLVILMSGFGLFVIGARLTADDWQISLAGAAIPAGARFVALTLGGLLIAVFALERLVTGDFQVIQIPEDEEG